MIFIFFTCFSNCFGSVSTDFYAKVPMKLNTEYNFYAENQDTFILFSDINTITYKIANDSWNKLESAYVMIKNSNITFLSTNKSQSVRLYRIPEDICSSALSFNLNYKLTISNIDQKKICFIPTSPFYNVRTKLITRSKILVISSKSSIIYQNGCSSFIPYNNYIFQTNESKSIELSLQNTKRNKKCSINPFFICKNNNCSSSIIPFQYECKKVDSKSLGSMVVVIGILIFVISVFISLVLLNCCCGTNTRRNEPQQFPKINTIETQLFVDEVLEIKEE